MTPPGTGPGSRRRAIGCRSWAVVLVTTAVLAVTLAACGGDAPPGAGATTTTTSNPADPWVVGLGGTLTVGIDRAPTGCNPNAAGGDTWANRLALEPVLPSAFFVGPGGTATYDSAVITQAEVVSTTPQTVVYTINPQAVWSDGVPISADDFVYAWHQQRGTPPTAAGTTTSTLGYDRIKSVTGSNHGRTVTVVFRTPFADWQMLFDDLLPAHVMRRVGWDPGCTTLDPTVDLSGGPFEIGKVVQGHEVVLVRNPHWWETAPYLDGITLRTARGPGQLATWMVHRKVDAVLPTAFTPSFLARVSSQRAVESNLQVSSTFLQLEFSMSSPVTADLGVREAVAHDVNRQALVNTVVGAIDTAIVPSASHLYSQSQSSYPGPRPPPLQVSGSPGYTPPSTSPTPSPSQPWPSTDDQQSATRELEAAGYVRTTTGTWTGPDGKPLDLRLAVDAGDGFAVQASAVVAHQLRQDGIGVTLVTAPDARATGMDLSTGAADAAVLPFDATPYPSEAIAWYTTDLGVPGQGGSQNWSNFADPTLEQILGKASKQLNPVDASPLYAEADAMLWAQMVALPLFAEPTAMAWSAYTAGVGPNPNGPGLLWSPENWGLKVPATSPDTATG